MMLLVLVALIWLAGTIYRIYQQARYFQIEEYKNIRYLRWIFAERPRWLPTRSAAVVFVGLALTVMLAEAPGDLLPSLLGMVIAAAAVWPARQKEVKKAFRATSRAKRLLGTGFVVAVLFSALILVIANRLPDISPLPFVYIALSGFLQFLLAPLFLIVANVLMLPVEAFFRRQFVQRARKVLDEVQPSVIGITGSYGKTSTKSYLAHILNGRYRAYPTPKSYNTLMGVTLAINNDLADNRSIDYFIV